MPPAQSQEKPPPKSRPTVLLAVLAPISLAIVAVTAIHLQYGVSPETPAHPEPELGPSAQVAGTLAADDTHRVTPESDDATSPAAPETAPDPPESGWIGEAGRLAQLVGSIGFGAGKINAPPWVPVFPDAKSEGSIRQWTTDGQKETIRAAATATAESVVAFYEEELDKSGFTVSTQEKGGETIVDAEGPDGIRSVTVAVRTRGASSTFLLTYMERLPPSGN